jgi:hypothetical protein
VSLKPLNERVPVCTLTMPMADGALPPDGARRPLGDKAYINSCVRQLISFLSSRGFDAALSPKTLAAPTAKVRTLHPNP